MTALSATSSKQRIIYPDSDGMPMAENTLQYQWIVTITSGLDHLFADRPDVFVAADLFWYPVEGTPNVRAAPDSMVVFGRPKGHRLSYLQWEEGGIAPQVVFEVLSPSNRPGEMAEKLKFYGQYGVEEYYIFDPDRLTLRGYIRRDNNLAPIPDMNGWVSPRAGIRFEMGADGLTIFRPDGQPFRTVAEVFEQADRERERADRERERADRERERAKQERTEAQHERERADRLERELNELRRSLNRE